MFIRVVTPAKTAANQGNKGSKQKGLTARYRAVHTGAQSVFFAISHDVLKIIFVQVGTQINNLVQELTNLSNPGNFSLA